MKNASVEEPDDKS